MSTLLRLDPPLEVDTPKGPGNAHVFIDNGMEHHVQWQVFIDETGESWVFDNPDVRLTHNLTRGRVPKKYKWREHWDKK